MRIHRGYHGLVIPINPAKLMIVHLVNNAKPRMTLTQRAQRIVNEIGPICNIECIRLKALNEITQKREIQRGKQIIGRCVNKRDRLVKCIRCRPQGGVHPFQRDHNKANLIL